MSLADVNDREYNNLLIVNESKDAKVTLYIYRKWLPISLTSKILQPNEKYLHREKGAFKFKLVANFDDEREKKEFPGPVELIRDILIRVTESLEYIEKTLDDYPEEKRICLRKMHLKNELPNTNGQVNLYSILDLNMEDVRKLDKDDQKKAIKKAFNEKIKIWHPDKNFGDGEIAMQIILAKETLLDDERRARYHNEADYDKGWLSLKRFKAIFWPDCYTDEQNKAYWRRIGLMALSLGIGIGGVILTVFTAGAAAPVVVCGAVFGGGLIGAGMLSGVHTISKDSVVNGCDAKSWLLKAGIGFLGGAVTGGAAAGITAGVAGIGSAALESSAVTFGQYAGIGAASGAVGGVASSLSSDAARKFVDGEEVTWKECLGHALIGAGIGAAAGTLGGLATKGIVNRQTAAGSAALEGEVVEQAAILTGARRFGYPLAQAITRQLAESGTEAVMGTTAGFIEERLDDSVENQNPMEHVKNGAIKATAKTVISGSIDMGIACVKHAHYERKIKKKMKGERFESKNEKQKFRRAIRHEESVKKGEHVLTWKNARGSGSYKPIAETDETREEISQANDGTSNVPEEEQDEDEEEEEDDGCHVTSEEGAQESQKATFKYISAGTWISKMIVTFLFHGEEIEREVSGSGKIVKVPADARQVKVRFQAWRPAWGDVMKYDRFKKKWCKPYEPHVFCYEKPPLERTFTISGNLGWEAVMRVSGENDPETGDGIDCLNHDKAIDTKCQFELTVLSRQKQFK